MYIEHAHPAFLTTLVVLVEEGGRGSRKFRPEAEIFLIFAIEVAPYWECH